MAYAVSDLVVVERGILQSRTEFSGKVDAKLFCLVFSVPDMLFVQKGSKEIETDGVLEGKSG